MANIFLDANYFIRCSGISDEERLHVIAGHTAFVSILTVHIYYYIRKVHVPDIASLQFFKNFTFVDVTTDHLERSLLGPTNDLEDNIQLHTASSKECDFFLTRDKALLKMKYFGKMKIAEETD